MAFSEMILIPFQPFSAFIVNAVWVFNLDSPHWHNLSRMTAVVHGSFETPIQTIMLLVLISRGVLQKPWEELTIVTDNYNNQLPLGRIGTISLVLCAMSLLKASCDTIEFDGIKQTLNGLTFSIVNLAFRIPALAIATTYLERWVIILVALLLIITTISFVLIKGSTDTTFFKATSSIAFSIFLPICAARYPYESQMTPIKDIKRKHNVLQIEKDRKREISCIVSFLTLPVIYISNVIVYLLVKYYGFRYDPNIVISDSQLEQIFLFYVTPMFCMAILSSAIFYPSTSFSPVVN